MVVSTNKNRKPYLYIAAVVGLVLVSFMSYSPSLRHYFWEDDLLWINEGSRLFKEPAVLFSYWPNFRPMFRLLVEGCHLVFGVWAAPYHFIVLSVNALDCVLVFVLLDKLFADRRIGFVAAVLFGSSASYVDAVYWLSAAAGPLSLMFALSALLSWTYYRDGVRPSMSYKASLLFFVLALLSKEEAMTFPILLVVTDAAFKLGGDVPAARRMRNYVPFAVILVLYITAQYYVQSDVSLRSASYRPGMFFMGTHSLYNVLSALFFMILPIKSLGISAPSWVVIATPLAVVIAALALYSKRRVAWAVVWAVVAFLPMSSYSWDFLSSIDSSFISRYLYTSDIGVAALVATLMVSLYDRLAAVAGPGKKALAPAACIILAAVVLTGMARARQKSLGWAYRSLSVKAEAQDILALHPHITSRSGFVLEGFIQNPSFNLYLLRDIYGDRSVRVFDSRSALEHDKGLSSRYIILETDTFMLDVGSGKTVPMHVDNQGTLVLL
jgi:hypothetical protein